MRGLILFALIVAVFAAFVSSSSAHSERITLAKAHYYHADGYLKAIGKNAHRTIYSSNVRVRHKWQRAAHYLILVRHRAYIILHPPPALPAWPPHHALWTCIHNHEGNWNDPNSGGNGHWGGLQMHPGWGYGTSYHASDDSQFIQEWAAENGYKASGYSKVWLYGQWAHSDCMVYS